MLLVLSPAPGLAVAPTTVRVSVSSSGAQANGASWGATISADGTAVAFDSDATNLSGSPDTNIKSNVFVRYLTTHKTIRVNVSTTGAQANGRSSLEGISADGRYVLFTSSASNLVAHDTNHQPDVFVRDVFAGTTRRVDVTNQGRQLALGSGSASISPHGRYVEFAGAVHGVYVRDLDRRTTALVSIQPNGQRFPSLTCGNCVGFGAGGVSEGGRVVVFEGNPALNFPPMLWARNRVTHATTRIDSGASSSLTSGATAITPNGRYVVFLHGYYTTGNIHVYVRDLQTHTTTTVGHYSEAATNFPVLFGPTGGISSDGNRVVYVSGDSGIVAGDTNGAWDAFLRDLSGGTVTRISLSAAGGQLNGGTQGVSISADGRFVAFTTNAAAVPQDTNRTTDIYIRGPLP